MFSYWYSIHLASDASVRRSRYIAIDQRDIPEYAYVHVPC